MAEGEIWPQNRDDHNVKTPVLNASIAQETGFQYQYCDVTIQRIPPLTQNCTTTEGKSSDIAEDETWSPNRGNQNAKIAVLNANVAPETSFQYRFYDAVIEKVSPLTQSCKTLKGKSKETAEGETWSLNRGNQNVKTSILNASTTQETNFQCRYHDVIIEKILPQSCATFKRKSSESVEEKTLSLSRGKQNLKTLAFKAKKIQETKFEELRPKSVIQKVSLSSSQCHDITMSQCMTLEAESYEIANDKSWSRNTGNQTLKTKTLQAETPEFNQDQLYNPTIQESPPTSSQYTESQKGIMEPKTWTQNKGNQNFKTPPLKANIVPDFRHQDPCYNPTTQLSPSISTHHKTTFKVKSSENADNETWSQNIGNQNLKTSPLNANIIPKFINQDVRYNPTIQVSPSISTQYGTTFKVKSSENTDNKTWSQNIGNQNLKTSPLKANIIPELINQDVSYNPTIQLSPSISTQHETTFKVKSSENADYKTWSQTRGNQKNKIPTFDANITPQFSYQDLRPRYNSMAWVPPTTLSQGHTTFKGKLSEIEEGKTWSQNRGDQNFETPTFKADMTSQFSYRDLRPRYNPIARVQPTTLSQGHTTFKGELSEIEEGETGSQNSGNRNFKTPTFNANITPQFSYQDIRYDPITQVSPTTLSQCDTKFEGKLDEIIEGKSWSQCIDNQNFKTPTLKANIISEFINQDLHYDPIIQVLPSMSTQCATTFEVKSSEIEEVKTWSQNIGDQRFKTPTFKSNMTSQFSYQDLHPCYSSIAPMSPTTSSQYHTTFEVKSSEIAEGQTGSQDISNQNFKTPMFEANVTPQFRCQDSPYNPIIQVSPTTLPQYHTTFKEMSNETSECTAWPLVRGNRNFKTPALNVNISQENSCKNAHIARCQSVIHKVSSTLSQCHDITLSQCVTLEVKPCGVADGRIWFQNGSNHAFKTPALNTNITQANSFQDLRCNSVTQEVSPWTPKQWHETIEDKLNPNCQLAASSAMESLSQETCSDSEYLKSFKRFLDERKEEHRSVNQDDTSFPPDNIRFAITSFSQETCTDTEYLKCFKRFLEARRKKHALAHQNNKRFSCKHCPAQFKYRSYLAEHLVTHSSERPFSCEGCGERFKKKSTLNIHLIYHSNDGVFAGNQYSKPFKCKPYMKKHTATLANDKHFICQLCLAQFKYRSSLEMHLLRHSNKKSFACNQCSRRYKRKSELKRHLVTHSDNKPFACALCPAQYKRKNELRVHFVCHFNETPFATHHCPNFQTKSNLKEHTALHSVGQDSF